MSDPSGTRILVVEDHPDMSALLARGLGDEGYAVETVAEGLPALLAARAEPPGLAVVDVMLPGMSGFELCRRLREQQPGLRVIMLTARDDVDDRVRGLDAGADDYLTKPFAFSELTARLRALLRRDAAAPRTRFEAGGVALDVLEHSVEFCGERLHLSPKEFDLLKLLMLRENETVTRGELLTELWGTTEHTHQNVVDQYVSYLRRKLDAAAANDPASRARIVTERGTGFRFTVA